MITILFTMDDRKSLRENNLMPFLNSLNFIQLYKNIIPVWNDRRKTECRLLNRRIHSGNS